MSMKGEMLGRGRTAEIFAWGEGKAIKVFHLDVPLGVIELEFSKSRAINRAGIPSAHVFEIVQVEGKPAIICERIVGETALQRFVSSPGSMLSCVKAGAELHARIHKYQVMELPPFAPELEKAIRTAPVPVAMREAAMRAFRRLPDGNSVCHGDFHADNVIFADRGAIALDWSSCARGNPYADVAFTALSFQLSRVPPGTKNSPVIEIGREAARVAYLEGYYKLDRRARNQVEGWMLPLAVAFTNDDVRVDTHRAFDLIRLLMIRERVEQKVRSTLARSRLLLGVRP